MASVEVFVDDRSYVFKTVLYGLYQVAKLFRIAGHHGSFDFLFQMRPIRNDLTLRGSPRSELAAERT